MKPDQKNEFVKVMKAYQEKAEQVGLDHSHLIESENEPDVFWYVTIWETRAAWEAVEKTDQHLAMHADREPLLVSQPDQSFGKVVL